MSFKTKIYLKLAFVLLFGTALTVIGALKQNLLFSMGTTMLILGGILLIRAIIRLKDPQKAKALENASRDERTAFVARKSYSFTFFVSILGEFLATVYLYLLGKDNIAVIIDYIICFQSVVYVVSSLYYNKKY